MAEYPIPLHALDDRLGWLGTSGSGKTYNAGGGVERLLQSGARVVIVDPLDVWWGLRLKADGSPSPFTLPIFGGEHGDLPLTEQAGKLIGETVAGMAESCIVSLGGLTTKASERRFMLAFLSALYQHVAGDPVHLILDEADMWAPQQIRDKEGEAAKLLGMVETVVRRGRIKGFIPWLISQRPAVINKDVLSQIDGLVAFKLTSVQDRDAIGDWVKGQADLEEWKSIWRKLPTMQRGAGVVWVPGRDLLETVQFPAKATFDSSRAPKRGERREHRSLKPLNLERLKGQLASIEEETKASDPKALKAEVARLTRELTKAQRAVAAPPAPERVVANADEIEAARLQGEVVGIAIGIARAQQAVNALSGAASSKAPGAAVQPTVPRDAPAPVVAAEGVTGPGQRILNALGWWKVFGFDAPTNEQVAFIAGYSPASSGYTNPRGALKSAGLIGYPVPGAVSLTEQGAEKAEMPDRAPTGEELRRRVLGRMSGPQQRILSVAIEAHPEALSNEELASRAGYSATSSGYTNPRGSLKTLSVIDYPQPGYVRAADWLFPSPPKEPNP